MGFNILYNILSYSADLRQKLEAGKKKGKEAAKSGKNKAPVKEEESDEDELDINQVKEIPQTQGEKIKADFIVQFLCRLLTVMMNLEKTKRRRTMMKKARTKRTTILTMKTFQLRQLNSQNLMLRLIRTARNKSSSKTGWRTDRSKSRKRRKRKTQTRERSKSFKGV